MNFENVVNILRENIDNSQIINSEKIRDINVYEALNYILAEDIYSPIDVPELRTSMRDGYAIFFSLQKENNSEFIINNFAYAGNSEYKNEEKNEEKEENEKNEEKEEKREKSKLL